MMPLFEYRCSDCDHRFEAIVSSGDTVLCPLCESEKLERLISTFAVRGGSVSRAEAPAAPAGGT